jgi:hypothetical protein
VLKRTTVTLANMLKEEIKFPSDTEMENLKRASFQNLAFCDCVCVINGTKVQISRPKKQRTSVENMEWKEETKLLQCFDDYKIEWGNNLLQPFLNQCT